MIYTGTDLKFKMSASVVGFHLKYDNFCVVIKNRWNQVKYIIEKSDMLTDNSGNYYFMITNVQKGVYYAELTVERNDNDFDSGIQHMVDRQYLVSVDSEEFFDENTSTEGMAVAYQRVWYVNVGGYVYLAESDGTPILDADGNRIYLRSSGSDESADVHLDITVKQLKELLEGKNDNGKIDTIPEMVDTLGGMEENTEVSVSQQEDIDNMMNRILNR